MFLAAQRANKSSGTGPKGELVREISKAESWFCAHLRPMLASLPSCGTLDDSDDLRSALTALEWFLPEVLQEAHPEWKYESLDGIYPALARKSADNEIEIIGLCCLISDQTLTPLHLRLQLDSTQDAVSWLECRLGESTAAGMRREPYSQGIVYGNKLHVLERLDSIDWVYHVGYGEQRK
jgi:hypothetical protein